MATHRRSTGEGAEVIAEAIADAILYEGLPAGVR